MVWWATVVTFIRARSLVVRGKTALSSLLPQSWYQWWGTWVLSFLIEWDTRPITKQRGFLLLER